MKVLIEKVSKFDVGDSVNLVRSPHWGTLKTNPNEYPNIVTKVWWDDETSGFLYWIKPVEERDMSWDKRDIREDYLMIRDCNTVFVERGTPKYRVRDAVKECGTTTKRRITGVFYDLITKEYYYTIDGSLPDYKRKESTLELYNIIQVS